MCCTKGYYWGLDDPVLSTSEFPLLQSVEWSLNTFKTHFPLSKRYIWKKADFCPKCQYLTSWWWDTKIIFLTKWTFNCRQHSIKPKHDVVRKMWKLFSKRKTKLYINNDHTIVAFYSCIMCKERSQLHLSWVAQQKSTKHTCGCNLTFI